MSDRSRDFGRRAERTVSFALDSLPVDRESRILDSGYLDDQVVEKRRRLLAGLSLSAHLPLQGAEGPKDGVVIRRFPIFKSRP